MVVPMDVPRGTIATQSISFFAGPVVPRGTGELNCQGSLVSRPNCPIELFHVKHSVRPRWPQLTKRST